jgi:hypothetical protein
MHILQKAQFTNDNDGILFGFVPAVPAVYFSEPRQLICLQFFCRMIQIRMLLLHGCEYNIFKKAQFTFIMMVCLVLFLPSLLFTFSEPCQLICLQTFFRMIQPDKNVPAWM